MSLFAPLHEHCIFRTREKVESHALIANELSDHVLRWHGERIDTRLCKLDTPRLSLYSLQYGSEVSIFPEVYDQFSLIHFSLNGGIEVVADGKSDNVPRGRVLVSTPTKNINLRWSHDSEQLIMRLPHDFTCKVARELGQPSLHERMLRTPGLQLAEKASALWRSQLSAFVALEEGKNRVKGLEPWLTHVEQGLAMFLLLQFSPVLGDGEPREGAQTIVQSRQRRLERLYAFVHANLDKPVTLTAMARAVALSVRQLNALCNSQLGQSPIAWLRGLRLDAIRTALLADPEADLSDIAMLHGFFHLGRFAAFYRDRFGELPSQTRRAAISG
ncbi:AraC family transcriptional regulator [Sinorhizobium meliloti]|uniref:AraC family transcriptional regulator n=1 Tax=Rhizobium meliloti TaxID=382 RepID=UPI0018932397|nr:AraC family transcriptional regulator [Sinorhizobium meliloti]